MDDRNVFAIYVSYYIKVKLILSAMGGEVVLKLPFILGHVDSPASVTSSALMADCTLASCRGVEAPDPRDRWATTRTDEHDDTTNTGRGNTTDGATDHEESSKDIDDDDEQTRQQSQSTDDSHRTTSVEDFILQQENTAAANWKLTTMDECGEHKVYPEKDFRKNTVRQSTITTTLARANATDLIVGEEEHLRRIAHEAEELNRERDLCGRHCEGQSVSSNKTNTGNSNANIITAQIHI